MKKMFALLLSLLLLCSCISSLAETGLEGGWELLDQVEELTAEDQEIFTKATSSLVGAQYEPVAVLGRQVVAGTNILYLAKGTTVTLQPLSYYAFVTIYADLSGNCTVTDIERIYPAESEESDVSEENPADESETPVIVGGWTLQEPSLEIPEDAMNAFNKAFEGFTGVGYEPIILLATQVVSGYNYCFLCKAKLVTAEPVDYFALVCVYVDTQGNCFVLSIDPIGE